MNHLLMLNDLICTAKHVLPFLPEKIETEKLYALRALHSRSEMNIKRIAVAGSFSSGKSTFINSILELTGDRAQATGISETTAVPTVIRPSSSTSFMRWDHGVLEKAPPAFEAAMLRLRADSVSDLLEHYFSSEMEFVREVELDEAFHGIEYLDLPGLLGIAGKRYDGAIRAGIWGSDGLVYVVNGRHGFQESDRLFAEAEVPEGMPVLVLVTHLGEGSAEEDVQVLAKIRESAGAAFKERFRGVCATGYDNAKELHEWNIREQRRLFRFQTDIEPMLLYDRCKEAAHSIVQKICANEEIPQDIRNRMKGGSFDNRKISRIREEYNTVSEKTPEEIRKVISPEMVAECEMAAKAGDADAQSLYGVFLVRGMHRVVNEEEAVKWYHLAAEQGSADGQIKLGDCYYYGNGVAENEREALKYYRLAAEQGNPCGQCWLGYFHEKGIVVPRDEREAVKWYRLAAKQGDAEGQWRLGSCLQSGTGVRREEREAMKYFRLAADQGYEEALEMLEDVYIITDACIACGACMSVCAEDAIIEGPTYAIDPEVCNGCGNCEDECPVNAIEVSE